MRKRRCFIRGQMHRLRRSRCKKSEIRHGFHFFYYIFSIGCTWFFSCRGRRRRRPAKKHKVTFLLLALLSDQKRGKSQQGGLAPSSFQTTGGVHELVAGSIAWQVCAARDKSKVGGFALSAVLNIPRVRTYHTRKPSRFVHALPARPLDNGWRGRG